MNHREHHAQYRNRVGSIHIITYIRERTHRVRRCGHLHSRLDLVLGQRVAHHQVYHELHLIGVQAGGYKLVKTSYVMVADASAGRDSHLLR